MTLPYSLEELLFSYSDFLYSMTPLVLNHTNPFLDCLYTETKQNHRLIIIHWFLLASMLWIVSFSFFISLFRNELNSTT